MSHNANTVLLGATRSNIRESINKVGTKAAGTAVRLKSDGTLSVTKADGQLMGVSLGRDLSNTNRTAICVRGEGVPLLLGAAFTPAVGAIVYISDTTGKGVASATDATATAAFYRELLTDGAIDEDGTTAVAAAIVDFPGGL